MRAPAASNCAKDNFVASATERVDGSRVATTVSAAKLFVVWKHNNISTNGRDRYARIEEAEDNEEWRIRAGFQVCAAFQSWSILKATPKETENQMLA